jgi:hypothetical protein
MIELADGGEDTSYYGSVLTRVRWDFAARATEIATGYAG